ncbi:MAG TPA: DUF2796 domain-containing protein [Steroidobacteraceae bacterium]|jgi:hypothetical protein
MFGSRGAAVPLALGLICAAGSQSVADEFRSRGVHEHGSATVDIAVQDAILDIALHSPAINVIGFEHAPRSAEERAALAQANRVFASPQGLFVIPPRAACTSTSVTLIPITYEHDGDDDKPNAPHADYDVSYRFRCAHADQLGWIDVRLFDQMKGMRKIVANVVTPALQAQSLLSPDNTRVHLRP